DTLYVIVVDQVLPATANPRITLVTDPLVDSSAMDRDTLPLKPIPGKPGAYVAIIPVDKAGATVPGNGHLRLANGDQITATYLDPVDTESPAVANAGYGVPPILTATLEFTNAAGTPVTAGSFYSPLEGKLYLTYTDDWLDGTRPNKTATLTIQNQGNAPGDSETLVMTLVPAEVRGTRGVWKGSINLKDGLAITPANGTVETYILGKVTATVTSHNPDGSAGPAVSDMIQVAYGDEIARIGIVDAKDSTLPIGRATDNLIVKLNEQSLSSGTDTLTVRLRCRGTGDEVLVKVIEVSPGVYVSQSIPKGEGPAANDGTLTCRESDVLKATYTDPVHNTQGELSLTILSPVTTVITYTTTAEPFTSISAVEENKAKSFRVVVDAFGKNTKAIDVITVYFTTVQGELDSVLAVETDVHSQKFVGIMPIAFTLTDPEKHNGRLEGKLAGLGVDNRIIATGKVNVDGVETSKPITLVAAFVQGKPAYIKDANLDGRADQVFIQFPRKLGHLPDTVEAQWNTESSDFKSVAGDKISFYNGDSTLVVADFSANPWPLHVTAIPPGQIPKVRLPKDDGLFLGQIISLNDSIGPMIISAIKIPAEVNDLDPNATGYNHDTLQIQLSEPIRSGSTTGLTDMLRFSQKGCGDYEGSVAILAVTEPEYDPVTQTYRVVVEHISSTAPLKGDCVFLNGHPNKVEDLKDNLPARVGVTLDGNDRKKRIQLFRGYPPVAGLDPNSPKKYYQVATQDPMDGKTGYVNKDGELTWIPPKGFSSDAKDFQSYIPKRVEDEVTGETETKIFESFPTAWSALQVVSSSRYIAKVSIFDNLGNFVRSFDYSFGYQGELTNSERRYRGAFVSWIPWNQRDRKGQRVGQGVYVWRVVFTYEKGKQEIMYTRTGITGQTR
ncbi:MAG TPA: hypothetical protein VK465_09460, partial [Fibrobacteria bacterium]|nr:hypothetical protein [Fibrobacteria bacterium]